MFHSVERDRIAIVVRQNSKTHHVYGKGGHSLIWVTVSDRTQPSTVLLSRTTRTRYQIAPSG